MVTKLLVVFNVQQHIQSLMLWRPTFPPFSENISYMLQTCIMILKLA